MSNNFEQIMSQKTNAEIYKIVSAPEDDFQPTALEVAKKEFLKREISEEQIANIKHGFEQQSNEKSLKANQELGVGMKTLSFLFPGLVFIIVSGI